MLGGLLLLAAPALAGENDVLCLKDGRFVEGIPMAKEENGVRLTYENGTVFVPDALILDAVIEGDTTFVPQTDLEKERFEKGLVPFEGRWYTPEKRLRLIEQRRLERREFVDDVKKHSKWRDRRMEETKHFVFHSTVPPDVFRYLVDLMEAYFNDFAKEWRIKQPRDLGKLAVNIYADDESYYQISGAPRGAIGYFRFVEPFDLNLYYDRIDPDLTEDVLFHEANHYLQKLLEVRFKMPHFPGESLAEYYGASHYDAETKKLETGLIQEGRLVEIQTDIDKGDMMTIERLILTDGAYEHYTWGWSLVHFLMNHDDHEKDFKKFVMDLARGKKVKKTDLNVIGNALRTVSPEEMLASFREYLDVEEDEELRELEREWHSYVMENLQLVSDRGLERAAIKALESHPPRKLRAKRLFQEAFAKGCDNPRAYHRFAMILREDRDFTGAIANWEKAIELDPLTGAYYFWMGKALVEKGQKEKGEKLMELAAELDPDDPFIDLEEIKKEAEKN